MGEGDNADRGVRNPLARALTIELDTVESIALIGLADWPSIDARQWLARRCSSSELARGRAHQGCKRFPVVAMPLQVKKPLGAAAPSSSQLKKAWL